MCGRGGCSTGTSRASPDDSRGSSAARSDGHRLSAEVPVLTIKQLADYVGVTVRAVRHYHARGLLPEPERDGSGYRRYGAQAVADLARIRTLAEAGVPLSRVHDLLQASPDEFARAVEEIDSDLRAEIDRLQRSRERVARLVSG